MLVRVEQYEILAEYKNLACDHCQFKQFSRFVKPYKWFWSFISSAFHVISMLILNSIGIGYFTCLSSSSNMDILWWRQNPSVSGTIARKRNGHTTCILLSWILTSDFKFNQSNSTPIHPWSFEAIVWMSTSVTTRTCSSVHLVKLIITTLWQLVVLKMV